MQTIIGRLTADAKVNQLEDGRKVVNFTIAENNRFKVKGSDTAREIVNYYSCSYWMGSGVAGILKKGSLIEAAGRLGVNAFTTIQGEAKANLTLHVNFLKPHGKAKNNTVQENTANANNSAQEVTEDLPF